MSQSPMTALNANDRCQLQEITAVLRRTYPKATHDDALLAAVTQTQATSFHDAVNAIYRTLVKDGSIKRSTCATR